MYKIYKITNKVNGKIYIGRTVGTLQKRFLNHKSCARRGRNTYLYSAFRKYGFESFSIDIVAFALDDFDANGLEKAYIGVFKSYINTVGYNTTMGGDGVIPNEATRKKISESGKNKNYSDEEIKTLYASGYSVYQIAHKIGSCHTTVIDRLAKMGIERTHGKTRSGEKHPRYRKDLNTEEFKDLYAKGLTTHQIAAKFGVHQSVVWRRLKKSGMSFRREKYATKSQST